MNIIWLPFEIVSSGGLGGIIAFVLIICGLGAGLGALIKLAANYWGMIGFILGNAALLFAIIRSIINYKNNGTSFFDNIKAHGAVFSIIWLLGTLSLLFVGYSFRELILIDSSQTVQFPFGALFGVIGIVAGAIVGSQLGEYMGDGMGAGAGFGAMIFAILFVIIGISVMFITRMEDKALELGTGLIIVSIIAGIAGAVIGAILGAILGGIGSILGVRGILIGGLSGIISGVSLGILLSIMFFEMLKSSSNGILGAVGAGELVLAASFGLFNLYSPENDIPLKGRIAFLVLLLLAALSIGIITNKYSKSGTAIKAAASTTTVTRAATLVTATVTSDALNLRAKPNASSTILSTLRKGTRVSVTGEVRNGWLPVEHEGKQGFVNNKFVSIEPK
jgi:hypothetical protein